MKIFSIFLCLFLVGWGLNTLDHIETPTPFKFWDNYGFVVGETVIATPKYTSPVLKPDTLTVQFIISDNIIFSNARMMHINSYELKSYVWKQKQQNTPYE